jgi:hypothetical protein
MVAAMQEGSLSGLGRAGVQQGFSSGRDAETVQSQANTAGVGRAEKLSLGKSSMEPEVAEFAATSFGLPLPDTAATGVEQMPVEAVDDKSLQSGRAVPPSQWGNRPRIGRSDPTNHASPDQQKLHTAPQVEPSAAENARFGALIQDLLQSSNPAACDLVGETAGTGPLTEPRAAKEPRPQIGRRINPASRAERGGVRDLRQSGRSEVKPGMTSREQIEAVTDK